MTIKKGTPIAKVVNSVYVWDRYGSNTSFIQEVGHHAPTLEQLNSGGWLLKTAPVYDSATHKLVAGSFSDDGSLVTQNSIELTQQELEAIAEADQLAADISAARERLTELATEFPFIMYYIGKTDIELDNAVNASFSAAVIQDPALLYQSLRQVNKQQSKAIRDIGDILAGMVKEDLRNNI